MTSINLGCCMLQLPGAEGRCCSVLPRPPVTRTRSHMEAARAEEGEPPAGSLTLAIRTLTGDTTTLRDVASSHTRCTP